MRNRSSHLAFTLVEMLMVMAIIAIIAALIVQVAGYANKKAGRARAEAEIKALSVACEAYNSDNGAYPREAGTTEGAAAANSTPPIDPRSNGDALAAAYLKSSLFLYQQLSGDTDNDMRAGDNGAKVYFEFKTGMMGGIPTGTNTAGAKVKYLQDPFGFSYGYSTAGGKDEDDYRAAAAASTSAKRSTTAHGYNTTFDLWSTAGTQSTSTPTDLTRNKWVKNW